MSSLLRWRKCFWMLKCQNTAEVVRDSSCVQQELWGGTCYEH